MNIWYGTGEAPWLSNLARRPFVDKNGVAYKSVEHAYQTWKAGSFDARVYAQPWKEGSKFIGKRKPKTADNWNLALMKEIMRASFNQNPAVKKALMATAGTQFTHIQDKGIWAKEFPKILMEIREDYLANS
jgi:predicted NAD-dependent protein-ADP-ribosyltransferase YbiA (DUF1768 family)